MLSVKSSVRLGVGEVITNLEIKQTVGKSIFEIHVLLFNPLPHDTILDWSKFKHIADDILKSV